MAGSLPNSCASSTASITGFTALEITELGSMVLAEMTDDGSSSDTATVKVVNINEDDSIQVEIVFYCAEISP